MAIGNGAETVGSLESSDEMAPLFAMPLAATNASLRFALQSPI